LPDEHAVRDDLHEIRQAALRAAGLTRQLLAFGGRQVMKLQALQLGTLIADLMPSLQRIVGSEITLVTELEPSLPATQADRAQLEHVMRSLSENARQAMPDGGELRIMARRWSSSAPPIRGGPAVADGDYVLLTVADTGTGMDEQTLSRLFEPFFTTKPFGLSAGLGLATVYGIVRQNGGYVWATSIRGAGSEFHVLLPVRDDAHERPPQPLGQRRFTVLLVDDEDTVRTVSLRLLERAGYRVIASSCGEEALLQADELEGPPDVLVTDLIMPRISGTRLASLLRQRWPALEVIYLSGFTEAEAIGYGLPKGESHFLSKPFEIDALLGLVAKVLEGSRAAA
jgi:CheY-like chemotaxis protein